MLCWLIRDLSVIFDKLDTQHLDVCNKQRRLLSSFAFHQNDVQKIQCENIYCIVQDKGCTYCWILLISMVSNKKIQMTAPWRAVIWELLEIQRRASNFSIPVMFKIAEGYKTGFAFWWAKTAIMQLDDEYKNYQNTFESPLENPLKETYNSSPTLNSKDNRFFAGIALMCPLFSAFFFFVGSHALDRNTEPYKGSYIS